MTRGRRPVSLTILALAAVGCTGNASTDQRSGLRVSFSPAPPSAGADVVFLRMRSASGELLVLDVIGRSIAAPLDGLDLVVSFDPSVVEAFGVLAETFLGTCGRSRPDNTVLLCADNVAGGANQTGVLLFSAHPQGAAPTPSVIAGDRVLATLSFRAAGVGSSSVSFFDQGHPAPGTGSFSRVTSTSDPGGAAAVAFDPDAPGLAGVEVRRGS